MFDVRKDDLSGEATLRLLALHLAGMRASSPPDSVYALDLSGLKAPSIAVWSVWEGNEVVGIGALKELGNGSAEVKSMRTHPDHLRRGVAALLLDHMVAEAKARGLSRLSAVGKLDRHWSSGNVPADRAITQPDAPWSLRSLPLAVAWPTQRLHAQHNAAARCIRRYISTIYRSPSVANFRDHTNMFLNILFVGLSEQSRRAPFRTNCHGENSHV